MGRARLKQIAHWTRPPHFNVKSPLWLDDSECPATPAPETNGSRSEMLAGQSGTFEAMDCTRLTFADRAFDEVVMRATQYHIADDDYIPEMIGEAIRVCRRIGHVHLVTRFCWSNQTP
jgi:hypothetical protein